MNASVAERGEKGWRYHYVVRLKMNLENKAKRGVTAQAILSTPTSKHPDIALDSISTFELFRAVVEHFSTPKGLAVRLLFPTTHAPAMFMSFQNEIPMGLQSHTRTCQEAVITDSSFGATQSKKTTMKIFATPLIFFRSFLDDETVHTTPIRTTRNDELIKYAPAEGGGGMTPMKEILNSPGDTFLALLRIISLTGAR